MQGKTKDRKVKMLIRKLWLAKSSLIHWAYPHLEKL